MRVLRISAARRGSMAGSENGYTEAHGLHGDERQPLRLGGENDHIAIKSIGGIKAQVTEAPFSALCPRPPAQPLREHGAQGV
jgi:hypothetical protein